VFGEGSGVSGNVFDEIEVSTPAKSQAVDGNFELKIGILHIALYGIKICYS
jgi:hypothetical protein